MPESGSIARAHTGAVGQEAADGGFCRAWGSSDDPDAPPTDCTALHERARGLLLSALESLEVGVERWLAADLRLPGTPPKIK